MLLTEGNNSSGSYRFRFQGQEMDNEIKGAGNSINFKYRMHDPRIGRFFAVDPLAPKYPPNSPYAFSENDVIRAVELEGLEKYYILYFYNEAKERTKIVIQRIENKDGEPQELYLDAYPKGVSNEKPAPRPVHPTVYRIHYDAAGNRFEPKIEYDPNVLTEEEKKVLKTDTRSHKGGPNHQVMVPGGMSFRTGFTLKVSEGGAGDTHGHTYTSDRPESSISDSEFRSNVSFGKPMEDYDELRIYVKNEKRIPLVKSILVEAAKDPNNGIDLSKVKFVSSPFNDEENVVYQSKFIKNDPE